MSSYSDSSFLLSLYTPDRNADKAREVLPTLQKPLSPMTSFHRIELRSGLARKVFLNQMTSEQVDLVWANIEANAKIFTEAQGIDWNTVMSEAERLAVEHTATCGTRSLDAIHVAIALHLGTRDFISFDKRQRELAELAGLNVLPVAS